MIHHRSELQRYGYLELSSVIHRYLDQTAEPIRICSSAEKPIVAVIQSGYEGSDLTQVQREDGSRKPRDEGHFFRPLRVEISHDMKKKLPNG
jgi:hypothetical protein